ncbi:hypothetical protein TTRE_0000336501 [Trichuris trichiura]|uniref:Uncharacterized protein n=1 Tax=Trichuris trichiura TaxID=36087 RepID=A0A077Z5J9_TRITR|nr:hypothetical protein TTRE_0000336501 [Trichuris trichiura]
MSSPGEKKFAERRNSKRKSFTRQQSNSAVKEDVKANAAPTNRIHPKTEEKKEMKTKADEEKLSSTSHSGRLSFLNFTKCLSPLKTMNDIFNPVINKIGVTATKLLSDRPNYSPSEGSEMATPPIETSSEMGSDSTTLSSVFRRKSIKLGIFKKRKTIVQTHAAKIEKPLGELAQEKNFNITQVRLVTKIKNKTDGKPVVKVPDELLQDRMVRDRVSFDTQLSLLGRNILNLLNGLIAEADLQLKTDGIQQAEQAKKVATTKQGANINLTKPPAICTCATNPAAGTASVKHHEKQAGKIIHSAGCPLGDEAEESELSGSSEGLQHEKDKANKRKSNEVDKVNALP